MSWNISNDGRVTRLDNGRRRPWWWREDEEEDNNMGKHEKPCPACKGVGWVWGTVVNRKTGSLDPHKWTCPGCGGTGRG